YVVDETLSPGQGCCAELVTGAAEGHGVEHERGIRHSTCDRARGGKADQVEGEWGLGDPATTGFESEDTAGGRRDAEGSTPVAAVGHGSKHRGQGNCSTSDGTAGCARGVSGGESGV